LFVVGVYDLDRVAIKRGYLVIATTRARDLEVSDLIGTNGAVETIGALPDEVSFAIEELNYEAHIVLRV
jgi:hypothetical protein